MRRIPDTLRERLAALGDPCAGTLGIPGIPGIGDAQHDLALGVVHEWMSVEEPPPLAHDGWIAPHGALVALAWRVVLSPHWSMVAERRVAWVGRRVWPSPRSMIDEHGSRALLAASLFIDPAPTERVSGEPIRTERSNRLWAAEQALACDGICAVIFDADGFDMVASRRTQLASVRARDRPAVLAIAVRPWSQRAELTAAVSRWAIRPVPSDASAPSWSAELMRGRSVAGFAQVGQRMLLRASWSWCGGESPRVRSA